MLGLYYTDETIESEADFIWGSQINNLQVFGPLIVPGVAFEADWDQDIHGFAGFGQATIDLTEKVALTLGGRWTRDNKDGTLVNDIPQLNNAGAPNSIPLPVTYDYDARYDEEEPSYTASLQYRFAPEVMAYLTYSRGYKSGGISMQRDAVGRALFLASPVPPACPPGSTQLNPFFCSEPPQNPTFGKETTDHFEIGMKSELRDGRVRLNAAAWHTSFDDLQQRTLENDGSFVVVNVKGATSQGVEVEPTWAITEQLTAGLALQYLGCIVLSKPMLSAV